jgi:hypothetical protein
MKFDFWLCFATTIYFANLFGWMIYFVMKVLK